VTVAIAWLLGALVPIATLIAIQLGIPAEEAVGTAIAVVTLGLMIGRRFRATVATIVRALSGKSLPKREVTEKILNSCGVTNPDALAQWQKHWVKVANLVRPLP
jgi:hypothetical protein